MSITAHNQFFGWVHSLKISRHSGFINPDPSAERPFPVIVQEPTIVQVYQNWNSADTGYLVTCAIAGLFISKAVSNNCYFDSIINRKFFFRTSVNLWIIGGWACGMFNSANRLQGFVPNGLSKKHNQEVLKYDYTSQFVSQSPWKYLFSGRPRPTNE